MKMDQVAIAYSNDEEKAAIKRSLGLVDAPWIKDTVKAEITVLGRHNEFTAGENVAELEFCMDLGGMQFELIRYTSGPNWINEAARLGVAFPMVAHVGFHLDEGEAWPNAEVAGVLVQEALTIEHSNTDVNAANRRYHYRIYRVGPSAYFKFIKRLTLQSIVEAKPATTATTSVQGNLPPADPLFQQTAQVSPAAPVDELVKLVEDTKPQPAPVVAAAPAPQPAPVAAPLAEAIAQPAPAPQPEPLAPVAAPVAEEQPAAPANPNAV